MRDAKSRDPGQVGQFFPIQTSSAVLYWAKVKTKPMKGTKPIKGTFALNLAAALVSVQQAAVDAYPLTADRLWATTAAVLALVGVVIGGLALARSAGRIGTGNGRMGAIVALVAGVIAVVNGGLAFATARGGPGTGNGGVGGIVALVVGGGGMVVPPSGIDSILLELAYAR